MQLSKQSIRLLIKITIGALVLGFLCVPLLTTSGFIGLFAQPTPESQTENDKVVKVVKHVGYGMYSLFIILCIIIYLIFYSRATRMD